MSTTPEIPSLFDWEMLDRLEQAIWGTMFAMCVREGNASSGATAADQAIAAIRTLSPSRKRQAEPEYEAARIGLHIKEEDFVPWYRVAYYLANRGHGAPKSDEECHQAYIRYAMSRSDYW
jgi:hypothetical protein